MRTNIEIDDELMAKALRAGPYRTKREAVEEGLKLLARKAAYREVLKWKGKLEWEGEPWVERDRRVASVSEEGQPGPAASNGKPAPTPAVKPPKSVRASDARR